MHLVLEIPLLLLTVLFAYLESFVKLFIPLKRKSVSGEIVLITGAGHGMGKIAALEFAKLSSTLVLWDINKQGVEETAAECRELGAAAHAYMVDCSKREDIYRAADKVKEEVGDVTILINNAGVIFCADVLTLKDNQIQKTFEVNVLAHFWTTRAFLPAMMRNNHGHVVTVASSAGHVGVRFMSDYWLLPILKPEDVVKELIDGILTNKKIICVPSSVQFAAVLPLFIPERAQVALNKLHEIKFDAAVGSYNKVK
ncbi:17-beta-hydroxysteroid dehydrogenase 13-like isoform X2 [Pleurodeles waltl]|uniref:17-beta-hydroxysteroid dehydrogenase 13-like isoform X2 n=1 Tax=Pleurodeles waltl TaxID=8319 RepID=UPI003709B594